jgi:hypothetical protein
VLLASMFRVFRVWRPPFRLKAWAPNTPHGAPLPLQVRPPPGGWPAAREAAAAGSPPQGGLQGAASPEGRLMDVAHRVRMGSPGLYGFSVEF